MNVRLPVRFFIHLCALLVLFFIDVGIIMVLVIVLSAVVIGLTAATALAAGLLAKFAIEKAGLLLTGCEGFGLSRQTVGLFAFFGCAIPAGAFYLYLLNKHAAKRDLSILVRPKCLRIGMRLFR